MTDTTVTANGYAVVAENVQKHYPTPEGDLPILIGIDIAVRKGEIVAITGESGAGKSTLLHLLGGLDEPTAGQITVDGMRIDSCGDVERSRFRNQRVGFVFQFHHLLPDFTALENVMMPCLMGGVREREARDAARKILSAVAMGHRLTHRPDELSGGEQQRVAVARALVNAPAVVFADEPSGNLDYRHSNQLHDLLWSLARGTSTTFVVATHDRALALRADREIRLENGGARELSKAETASYFDGKSGPARGTEAGQR
jgi:lipoprotein-releasing system ATP-binding protein